MQSNCSNTMHGRVLCSSIISFLKFTSCTRLIHSFNRHSFAVITVFIHVVTNPKESPKAHKMADTELSPCGTCDKRGRMWKSMKTPTREQRLRIWSLHNKVSHHHVNVIEFQRQAKEWESRGQKIKDCLLPGEARGELIRSNTSCVIHLENIFSFPWLALRWKQGKSERSWKLLIKSSAFCISY